MDQALFMKHAIKIVFKHIKNFDRAMELAKTQMKLGNNGQAATILTKLLRTNGTPEGHKQTAQKLIGKIIQEMSAEQVND